MIIYDISKELFSAKVYPGDPVPSKESWLSMERGDICNLTKLSLGSHSGTHMDAPKHFIPNGKTAADVSLKKCVGNCQVVWHNGKIESDFWSERLEKGIDKILIRGNVIIDVKAAEAMVKYGINLIGVEAPTVGDKLCQEQVHRILLGNEIVILENLQLENISEGRYFLAAQPLKIQGIDGSPVRAILIADI